jgi:hypothetical protein
MKITETHKQAVIDACIALVRSNKKPTTALVKIKLGQPLPLALIIEGVNYFKANADELLEKDNVKQQQVEQSKTSPGVITGGQSPVDAFLSNPQHARDHDVSTDLSNDSCCECCKQTIANLMSQVAELSAQIKEIQSLVKA